MTIVKMQSCCASCVAYKDGCCLLTDYPVPAESVCTDFRPDEDEYFKTNNSYGR